MEPGATRTFSMRFLRRKMSNESSLGSFDPHEDTPFTTSSGGRPSGKFKGKKKPSSITVHISKILDSV